MNMIPSSSTSNNNHNHNNNHAMTTVNLELQKSSSLPSYLQKAAVQAMIFHLLFVRKILPLSPMDILDLYYAEREKEGKQDNGKDGRGAFQIHNDATTATITTTNNTTYTTTAAATSGHHFHCNHHIHTARNHNRRNGNRNASTSTRKEAKAHRKLLKCGEQLHQLIHDLEDIFHDHDHAHDCDQTDTNNDTNNYKTSASTSATANDDVGIKAVLLTIGPSFHSPREQYLLQFHSWCNNSNNNNNNNDKTTFVTPPPHVKDRLENEIQKRIIREFISVIYNNNQEKEEQKKENQASCENHYQKYDQYCQRTTSSSISSSSRSSSSKLKMNIACLITKSKRNELFHSFDSNRCTSSSTSSSPTPSQANLLQQQKLIPFTIQRDFTVKVPRMISKKKDIHRPFVIINIKPMFNPATTTARRNENYCNTIQNSNGPSFYKDPEDVWISFNTTVKSI